ncbi:MAG TPA: hypothetical protein VLY63_32000, partial [Anaerolineae bacterium]|nr:hypothetical protein [Anaerolineae bacterium]
RDSVTEGKRGRKASNVVSVLRELNGLVHLEIPAIEDVLSQAVAHEYDKWAQRQLAEIMASATRSHLADTTWTAIAEHLLDTHYIQRQVYDREHRRRTTWLPRFPLSYLAQAQIEGMDGQSLRDAVLASLRWAAEQREQVWGQEELQRWGQLSLADLDADSYNGLLAFLGERELGDLRDRPIEDLPPELYDRLRFILTLHRWEDKDLRIGDLPQSEILVRQLSQALDKEILDTPVGELDDELRTRIGDYLRQAGLLDDPEAKVRLLNQPMGAWDQQTRDEVAVFWGRQFIEAQKGTALTDLAPGPRETVVGYLQRQLRFVDEDRVQRFLVHERLSDLPPDKQRAALLHLARSRLDRLSNRKISNLDVNTRQAVIDSLQRMGLFTDQARRDELRAHPLTKLEPEVLDGFGIYVAQEQIGSARLLDLKSEVWEPVITELRQSDALTNHDRVQGLATECLGDLDGTIAAQIRKDLVEQFRSDLADKTMEELPDETRRRVHEALDEQNYFVDQEKVGWYERRTLAQLPSDLLRGLEQHLGQLRFTELADVPFRELPPEDQDSTMAYLDDASLLSDRAERLRLTQTGALGELPPEICGKIAHHLGRQWLVQIRNRRPPDLPDHDQQAVWVYLRAQGHFADDFKEELFAYQRLGEFDRETRQDIESTLVKQLTSELDSKPIGDLSPELQSTVRARLGQADYFVDHARLRKVEESPVDNLPPDLRAAVEQTLGAHLLAGMDAVPIAELPAEAQAALWRYLDEVGYFVDEKKRSQVLDRRLADLRSESYETVVTDLAQYLETETGDRVVAELDDHLRQGLREALEALGYFESEQVRDMVLAQPLGNLRREDLDALAAEFGQNQLETWSDRKLTELPTADQEA